MTVVNGARNTGNVESTIRKRDIRSDILMYDQNVTPLLVLTSSVNAPAGSPAGKPGLASARTANPKFEWYEEDRDDRITTTTTTGSTATSITVGDATLFAEHDIWRNTTNAENIRVVSVDSATTLTVIRGVGGSASTWTSGDELMRIGSAQPEFDTSRDPRSGNPTAKYNYTQIFRDSYAASRTWKQSESYTTPDDWDWRAMRAMQEHKINIESAFWWGTPSENTSGSAPRRTTAGFYSVVTTNVKDPSGTMTEAEFWSYFSDLFRYGGGPNKIKFGFAGRGVVEVLQGYPRAKLELVQGDQDSTYGLSVLKFKHAFGTLNLFVSNLFSDSTEYANHLAVVDLFGEPGQGNLVRKRYLEDAEYGSSDTHIRERIQEPDRDGRKDEILSEVGVEWALEKAHGYVKNVTG